MPNQNDNDIARVLRLVSAGDQTAWTDLMRLIYEDLTSNAAAFLDREKFDHPFQPPDLVHEAYLRLQKQTRVQWKSRAHFLAVASMIMERILIEQARRNHRVASLSTSVLEGSEDNKTSSIDAIRDAIAKLEKLNFDQALIVRLRFFGGLSVDEIADFLETPKRTIEREWTFIKCWFKRELEAENGEK